MRSGIKTVPRDGKAVILEDDASGIYELAHWSDQEQAWIAENGKPVGIIPTHWHAVRRDAEVPQEQPASGGSLGTQSLPKFAFPPTGPLRPSPMPEIVVSRSVAKPPLINAAPSKPRTPPVTAQQAKHTGRRFALFSIAAAMIISSLTGLYFRAEVTRSVRTYAGQHDVLTLGPIGRQLVEQAMQFSSWGAHKTDRGPLTRQAKADGGSAP